MISAYLMGGLGNQLFQIFATMAYALEHNISFTFFSFTTDRFNRYWNTFLLGLKKNTVQVDNRLSIYKEKGFHFKMIPKNIKQSFKLYGYFQSEKYFKNEFHNITHIIQLEKHQKNIIQKYKNYFKTTIISLHFRIGDYAQIQDCHPLMPLTYYKKSLQKIMNEIGHQFHVLYFCQQKDNDIVKKKIKVLKQSYPEITFIKASDDIVDWEQMLLMSCCKHRIIANSTFSWWGAYFNNSTEKIVCYPDTWFGPKLSFHNTNDLCPDEWNKIPIF